MLEIGKANEVKFKVGVNGTAASPTVRLIIGDGQNELGFKAEELHGEPGRWFSEVKIPENFKPGSYDFRVEVLLNNRLFTPIKNKVDIGTPEPVVAVPIHAEEGQPATTPATPTQTPDQTKDWEDEGGALPGVKEVPHPLPPEKVNPKPKSLMQQFTPEAIKVERGAPVDKAARKAAGGPVKVEPKGNVDPPKKKYTVKTNLPQGKKPLATPPLKVKISEIANELVKGEKTQLAKAPKVVEAASPARKPMVSQIPVALKKGEIVYE